MSLLSKRILEPLRKFAATLFKGHLDPGHAAAAVFLGVFIANVPIYGFQTLAILGLAALFRLNAPLAVGASFINNPILQPFLVVGALEAGHFILTGTFLRLSFAHSLSDLKSQFWAWIIGSVVVGVLLGGLGAGIVFLLLRWRRGHQSPIGQRRRFVNDLFAGCPGFDRGFVRWKMRLDRVFDILSAEDLGSGLVVDLGCGYGIALGFAAFQHTERILTGCDLDKRRIGAARAAFRDMKAEFLVDDVRTFYLPQASLIFIFDVLQYLTGPEQVALLKRCAAALTPGGKLIFRVPDRGSKATSRLSMAFDRLIFFVGKNRSGPVVLSAAEYGAALDGTGVHISQRRLRNRLPIAHLLFVVTRPEVA
jgi:uncharacterized protein (DUF2062 family)/2-polyprenyl-3-methyl-5-hydroxy-6-metoxy-1,4-benzoquinol methylase